MKEYLVENIHGKYKVTDHHSGFSVEDLIEIPEWANYAWKDRDSVWFTSLVMGYRDAEVIWKRPTHPEPLPFIDGEKDMREYLNKVNDFKYELVIGYKNAEFGAVEVPCGANEAFKSSAESPVVFSRSGCGYSRAITVWKRCQQGESINDQYAEIEQVRQSQKTIDAVYEAEGILSDKQLKGIKYDNDKPRHSLLPKGSVNAVIDVLEFGAKKYEADNWKKVDNAKERYYNAAMRHIDRWWNGEKRDPETNIHHLAHAATSLFFLIWFDENGE